MSGKKLPIKDTEESKKWCLTWDCSTHLEKLKLCNRVNVTYSRAKHYRAECRTLNLIETSPQRPDASWEEHLRVMREMDDLIGIHQLIPTEITIKIPTELPIGIVYSADWHLGQFGCDYDNFESDMNLVESEPGLYVALGGDCYHNIIEASKMGSSHNQTPVAVQRALYVQTTQKIKGKLLYISTGNHPYWTTLLTGEDWDSEWGRRLNVIYTKHFAKINFVVGDILYSTLRLHKGRFESSFNLTHSCKQYQRMYFPEARIVSIEHRHVGDMEQYRYNDNECVAIRTGTYGVYDDYAQQHGFFGAHVCNPTVVLYPNEDRLVGFKDMREAVIYLRAVRNG